jgi:hypothetical protein
MGVKELNHTSSNKVRIISNNDESFYFSKVSQIRE